MQHASEQASPWRRVGVTLLVIVAALAVMWAVTAARGGEDLVGWTQDFQKAQARAQAEGKPMLVEFTADWCVYCQRMKSQVYSRPAVADAIAAGFVAVKVDMTRPGQAQDAIARQLSFDGGVPVRFIVNPDGQTRSRQVGYVPAVEAQMIQRPAQR